uniref:Ig-like domain-containing protein n=1 Tax=Tetranychus urticae TaxID=32264 RepID=T1KVX8_TETUR
MSGALLSLHSFVYGLEFYYWKSSLCTCHLLTLDINFFPHFLLSPGIPRPTLTWWKDDKPLIASYEMLSNELTRSDLTLTNLSRTFLLSKITCKASNAPLIEPLTTSITINLNCKQLTNRNNNSAKSISSTDGVLFSVDNQGSSGQLSVTYSLLRCFMGSPQREAEKYRLLANKTTLTWWKDDKLQFECKIILLCRVFKLKTMWILILPSYLFLCSLNYNLVESQNLEIDYSGHIEVEAIAGKSVSLPCNISITHGNSREVAIILWYKDDTGIPVYTVDIRNKSSLSSSIHLPSSSYKSRSYFEMSKSPPTLRLDKIESKDSGEYRCRVDYEKYPTQNFLVNLTVIVPPDSISILNTDTMEKLQGLVGPFNESTDLNLSCESYGGFDIASRNNVLRSSLCTCHLLTLDIKFFPHFLLSPGIPRPTLTWWKDDKPLIASYEMLSNELTRSDLTLTNLSRSFLLSKITCKASNAPLIEPLTTSITINLNCKQLTSRFIFNLLPPARLYWWLDGRRLTRSRDTISKDGNETMSLLSFTGTASDNGKELVCQAENPLMKNSSLEESVRLNIHYTPLVNIVLGAKIDRDSIREGSDVYFECIIEANPWITEVTWIFNGSPLMSQPSSGIIISNQSLVLQKVKRQNRGYYSCSALNSEGIGSSDTFYLKVKRICTNKVSAENLNRIRTQNLYLRVIQKFRLFL